MTFAALPSDTQSMWWIALGLGVVVLLAVGALLHLLLNVVKRIERNVIVLWETATTVARNTATTWLLTEAADTIDDIKAEALKHDEFLTRVTER